MNGDLIATIATAAVTLLGTIITVLATNKKTLNEMDKKSEISDLKLDGKLQTYQEVMDVKIGELTREVREHNDFARRIPVIEEKIKVANNRLNDLEKERRQ